MSEYDAIPFDVEAPVLGLRGIYSAPSLPLLLGPLWPGMAVPLWAPTIDQIELFINIELNFCIWYQIELFNHLLYLKPFNCMQTNGYN